ncbi:fumarylacetoacetase [Salmonirosea aquatica]|uniref:fumarylacetoacetase n=1 Tax=Salmonirosea aquatica TaxID=2654236 RepID=A0A7C9BAH0_9BACT|nr:fumarylacetoacetase [Cytophagaceae bacterium SJW1-29]
MTLPASWLPVASDSDFSVHNLPFGVFSTGLEQPRVGVAIGDFIIDMSTAAQLGVMSEAGVAVSVFQHPTLNPLMSLGRPAARRIREILQRQLTQTDSFLHKLAAEVLVPQAIAQLHLPVAIGDYTDFYSSLEHATQVGQLFRPNNPLLPNWKHLPVAYHGRSSSIVVSGTPINRPNGQVLPMGAEVPIFQPTQALDYELELGFVIGKNSKLGVPVSVEEAEEYIFGCVLFNDWSARDIQRWEYQPLGPFLSKNFASSLSPWVVTLDALETFRVAGPEQNPEPLPYLRTSGALNFDLNLEVAIKPQDVSETVVCRTSARYVYWNIRQQLAHHTVSGCNLRVGDLLATGTISGPDGSGCLLELTEGGKKPIRLTDGTERTYLQHGDEVIMRGHAGRGDVRVGFGEVRGSILDSPESEN